jgi:hypothetical protein
MEDNVIIIKKSTILGNIPNINALENGELAINCADGYIFFKKNNGDGDYLAKFVDLEGQPYVLDTSLSAIKPQYGNNTVGEVFATVLGGYHNDVEGAASTVVNGENNDIFSDFSLIANGLNNKILSGADYSFIGCGENNLVSHRNVFTLGSNLSSHDENFTYVNNISATGKIYGDGSELTGIVGGGGNTNYYLNIGEPVKFSFTGNGSTTTYTISGTNNSTNAALVQVYVENVYQEPFSSYTLSNEQVEFLVAPDNGSNIVIISPDVDAVDLLDKINTTYTTVCANSASWESGGSGGTSGTKTLDRFTPRDNQPPSTNFATLDTRNSIAVLDFDAATDESAIFVGFIPEGSDLSSGLKVRLAYTATSATSGTVRWGVQFEKSDLTINSDSFDSATEVTSTTSAASGVPTIAEITATTIDSLSAGDLYRLKVFRNADDATNDTMTGDAELIAVEVRSAA